MCDREAAACWSTLQNSSFSRPSSCTKPLGITQIPYVSCACSANGPPGIGGESGLDVLEPQASAAFPAASSPPG